MSSQAIFDPKLLGETRPYVFNFLSDLAITETISSAATTVTVYSGTDASPSSMLSGSSTISGSQVTQKLTGGVVGVIYEILCAATSSSGSIYQQSAFLAVVPDMI